MTGSVLPPWLWHPLGQCVGSHAEYVRCRSYNFWSGIGSDIGEITVATGLLVYLRKHNCHNRWCPFIGWKPHPDDPDHIICRLHHPHHHWGPLTKLHRFTAK